MLQRARGFGVRVFFPLRVLGLVTVYGRLFHHVDEAARCFGESRNAKMACYLFAAAKIGDEIDALAIR